MDKTAKLHVAGSFLLLSAVVCAVVFFLAVRQERLINRQVHEEANALFEEIVIVRHWNSEYGGVYVKKMSGEKSNPFLKNPDITATDGTVYTLKNPATMTHELSEFSEKTNEFRLHITSLILKNPQNKPDDWERAALKSFAVGVKEKAEVINTGKAPVYRLMRPLYVEKACLTCHDQEGYRIGDVRGGISITLPYAPFSQAIGANYYNMATLAAALVLILGCVFRFVVWRLMTRLNRQKLELEALNARLSSQKDELVKLNTLLSGQKGELEALNAQLTAQKGELEVLNTEKDRLMGIAAHDLRNPLVIVSGYAELMQDMVSDSTVHGFLDEIKKATDRMLELISSLLDVSKIKHGRLVLRPEDVDIMRFIDECRAGNEPIGNKKRIHLVVEVDGEPGMGRFDHERIRQAVDNLIGNAFKYSHPGTTVVLGAVRDKTSLRIWVKDQGVGIKSEELPRVFDEFVKTSSKPTAGEPSYGLGLAIVKRVVEAHGGQVYVDSESGNGSTFTIELPV